MDNYPPSAHLQIDCKKREWLRVVPKWEPSKQQEMSPALICTSYPQLRWGASLPWRSTWMSWSKWTWWTSPTRRPWTFSWTQAQEQTRGPWRLQYQVSQPVSEFLKTHITLVVSWDATLRIRLSWGTFQNAVSLPFWFTKTHIQVEPNRIVQFLQWGSVCRASKNVFCWNNETWCLNHKQTNHRECARDAWLIPRRPLTF